MEDLLKARVYVGTYGKYASGSIVGAWLNLADYESKEAFVEACNKLHSDEDSPELMFQDCENLSDGYISECDIYDIWPVLNLVKKWSKGYYAKFLAWCDESGCYPDTEAVEEFKAAYRSAHGGGKKKAHGGTDEEGARDMAALKALYIKFFGNEKDAEEYVKDYSAAVKLSTGVIVTFEKPKIETRFCFGYSDFGQGYTDEEATRLAKDANTKEYFISENLRDFNDNIKCLDEMEAQIKAGFKTPDYVAAIWKNSYVNTASLKVFDREWRFEEAAKRYPGEVFPLCVGELSDDYKRVKATYLKERDKFAARLEAYWKRYGASKLKTWTYWADE